MSTQTLRFQRGGRTVQVHNVPPTRTLLQLLREDLRLCAAKEGCNEGDCGACTVVLREAGSQEYRAVNSCIRMAHSIAGMELTTVEDLGHGQTLDPAQEALVKCHGSQCGFCTPGFVMSMYALRKNAERLGHTISRSMAQEALSGNLCRCTGYRPILDAAVQMTLQSAQAPSETTLPVAQAAAQPIASRAKASGHYLLPHTLTELLALRRQHPQAQLVAGCTDVGLWVNKAHRQFAQVLDLTQVQELRRIERYPHHIAIGAAVSLHDAFAAMQHDRPHIAAFVQRFAGLPVRNSGTLGGNIANGSPIGDSMPLLIALRANVVLMSQRGHREMPLESLYTGYRQNLMAADEVLAWIKLPLPTPSEFSRVYKISKRFDDDISAVCLAISAERDGEHLSRLSIGVGGVAATPVRAIKTQALGQEAHHAQALFVRIRSSLMDEFQPISDLRASSAYRRQILGALVERYARQWRGDTLASVESWANLQEVLA